MRLIRQRFNPLIVQLTSPAQFPGIKGPSHECGAPGGHRLENFVSYPNWQYAWIYPGARMPSAYLAAPGNEPFYQREQIQLIEDY